MENNEDQYRQVFETIPDGLLLLEQSATGWRVVACNAVAVEVLGLPAGAADVSLQHQATPALAFDLEAGSRACLERRSTVVKQFDLQRGFDSATYRCTFTLVQDAEARVAVLIRDITQEKQLQSRLHASAEEFRALVANAPDFISRYDTQGRILYNNPAIERLGRSIAELRGLNSLEVSPGSPSAACFHERILEVARTATPMETELLVESYIPGRVAWHHVRFVPERDEQGRVVSVLGIGRDITEIKSSEAKMRALAEHLSLA